MTAEEKQRFIALALSGFTALEWLGWILSQWLQNQLWFQQWINHISLKES